MQHTRTIHNTNTHTLYLSFPNATNLNTLHSSSTCFVLIVGSLSSLQIQQPWVTAAIVSLKCQLSLSLSLSTVSCSLTASYSLGSLIKLTCGFTLSPPQNPQQLWAIAVVVSSSTAASLILNLVGLIF